MAPVATAIIAAIEARTTKALWPESQSRASANLLGWINRPTS